jgi:(1->4)-alpha-D-glucan 1-alpha-D-glucosylmutase
VEERIVFVIVPRFLTRLIKYNEVPLGRQVWHDTVVILPDEVKIDHFLNIFTGEIVKPVKQNGKRALTLGEMFAHFPVALLEGESDPSTVSSPVL